MIEKIAIHNGEIASQPHQFRLGQNLSARHRFQIIDLHLYGGYSRCPAATSIDGHSSSGIRQRRQHSAVHHSVDLQMALATRMPTTTRPGAISRNKKPNCFAVLFSIEPPA